MGNLQLATHNTHFLQAAENLFGHTLGQIDEAVILVNIDVPDVAPLETRLIRNRADDISGLHTVCVSDFDTVRLEGYVAWRAARLARGRTLVTATTLRTLGARDAGVATLRALVSTARNVVRMLCATVPTVHRGIRAVRATIATWRSVVGAMRTTVPTGCARVSAVRDAFWAVLTSCPAIWGGPIRTPVLARLRRRSVTTRLLPRISA